MSKPIELIAVERSKSITFRRADFFPLPGGGGSARVRYCREYSEKEKQIISEYFGDKAEISVRVIPFVLNVAFGGFGLSEEAKKKLGDHYCYEKKDLPDFRMSAPLIDMIDEIGLEKARKEFTCILSLDGIPAQYSDCVIINEYDGAESVELDLAKEIQNLATDPTLGVDEMRARLTEIAFFNIVFSQITNKFRGW